NDWNLETDFSMPMYRAGDPNPDFSGYEVLSNAYLRYDADAEVVYALVLDTEKRADISTSPGDSWVKIYEFGRSTLIDGNSGNDGDAPDFAWVKDNEGGVIGWEGSFPLAAGLYEGVEIHVNHGGDTSSTGKSNAKGVDQTQTVNTDDLLMTVEEPVLDVEFSKPLRSTDELTSEPLRPIDELTPQVCTDELKRQPLVAGQNTDVGFVCARVEDQDGNGDADTLIVTYETDNGWHLDQTHLWVKNNEDPMLPANKKGNPKIGNFPYVSEYVADTVKEVEIPLENFGDLHEMLCSGSGMALELNADLAAHASVLHDTLGQETAWAAGEQITAKGSWAMKTATKFICK
ncbi:MAG: hypothetical protein D3925_17410, partial [Candidatus Electrothrix sp. AR5]|nr:hypothetical protein [Candidatus Electrothrix sp. AR5]